MGYNIVRYQLENEVQWGVLKGETIAPFIKENIQLKDILTNHLQEASFIASHEVLGIIQVDQVSLLSPATRPTRLLCLGLNYYEHREEAQTHKTKAPVFFRKDESSLIGAHDNIRWPEGCHLLDYEVEMGLVMKKAITEPTKITSVNVGQYIAGMILVNDMSPRDLMFFNPFSQWYLGKSWRTMCPMGPSIYIFDEGEVTNIHEMELKLWVNDDLRQDANTKDMINKPEQALTTASQAVDLEVGDIFLTGTPGGVAIQAPSKVKQKIAQLLIPEKKIPSMMIKSQLKSGRFLKEGDTVRCTLSSPDGRIDCGEQKNLIVK